MFTVHGERDNVTGCHLPSRLAMRIYGIAKLRAKFIHMPLIQFCLIHVLHAALAACHCILIGPPRLFSQSLHLFPILRNIRRMPEHWAYLRCASTRNDPPNTTINNKTECAVCVCMCLMHALRLKYFKKIQLLFILDTVEAASDPDPLASATYICLTRAPYISFSFAMRANVPNVVYMALRTVTACANAFTWKHPQIRHQWIL